MFQSIIQMKTTATTSTCRAVTVLELWARMEQGRHGRDGT